MGYYEGLAQSAASICQLTMLNTHYIHLPCTMCIWNYQRGSKWQAFHACNVSNRMCIHMNEWVIGIKWHVCDIIKESNAQGWCDSLSCNHIIHMYEMYMQNVCLFAWPIANIHPCTYNICSEKRIIYVTIKTKSSVQSMNEYDKKKNRMDGIGINKRERERLYICLSSCEGQGVIDHQASIGQPLNGAAAVVAILWWANW